MILVNKDGVVIKVTYEDLVTLMREYKYVGIKSGESASGSTPCHSHTGVIRLAGLGEKSWIKAIKEVRHEQTRNLR